jgi:hypothetical protein
MDVYHKTTNRIGFVFSGYFFIICLSFRNSIVVTLDNEAERRRRLKRDVKCAFARMKPPATDSFFPLEQLEQKLACREHHDREGTN